MELCGLSVDLHVKFYSLSCSDSFQLTITACLRFDTMITLSSAFVVCRQQLLLLNTLTDCNMHRAFR